MILGKNMKRYFVLLFTAVFILVSGCSKKEVQQPEQDVQEGQTQKNEIQETQDEPEVPENLYFVNTDSLKVRDAPNMQGNKVGSLEFGSVVEVFETQGSGEYKDGIQDKWCRISNESEQWANYFYLSKLPAKLEYEDKYETGLHKHNEYANVYETLPEKIIIENIVEENGKKYFIISIDDNHYYHKDLDNIKVALSPVIKDYLPESFLQGIKHTKSRNIYLNQESDYYELDENGEQISLGYSLPENAVKAGNLEWVVEPEIKNFNPQEFKVQDNVSLRKYDFCNKAIPILRNKKFANDTILEYGIKIGMSKKDLVAVIGKPDVIEDGEYWYENYTPGYGETVIIRFNQDVISEISYSIDK